MFSDDSAIRVLDVSKCYPIYAQPSDRLREAFINPLRRLGGLPPRTLATEFWALQDVTLDIPRGASYGIIGTNGSGKSTLLQLICGTLSPTAGKIETRGRIAALLELGAGFNPEFTGRENVYLNAAILGLSPQRITERLDDILAFADIGNFIDRPVKTYSSGMYVRLAFSVIAHVDADILIIDEALAVGDAYFTQKCMRFLHEFMARGTVLFVSHDIASVKALASHCVWLDKGHVRAIDTTRRVADEYLKSLYARDQEVERPKPARPASESATSDTTEPHSPADFRQALMSSRPELANPLQLVLKHNGDDGFGDGRATVESVQLLDDHGEPLASTHGGEVVQLEIRVQPHEPLDSPIIGFFLRNRLGQHVFGDNTYLTTATTFDEASRYSAGPIRGRFKFVMPFLPPGEYSICAAVASGSNTTHVQHHWVNEALIITSLSSNVHADVLGLPMISISLESA